MTAAIAAVKTISQFEIACSKIRAVEILLNITGYVPILGTCTAFGRGFLGAAEVVSGIALLLLGVSSPAATLIIHGGLNLFRSSIEYMPITSTILCFPFDLFTGFQGLTPYAI